MRKNLKKLLFTLLCVVLIAAKAWDTAITIHLIYPGVDLFVKPESGFFATVTRGYMRLRTDKSKYHADDTINVKINTAFHETDDNVDKVECVAFVIGCDQYIEVNPSSFEAEKDYSVVNVDAIYGPFSDDELFRLTTTDFQRDDLVYKGPIITRYSLPYSADFTLQVMEDAPEEFSGQIRFFAGVSHGGYITVPTIMRRGSIFIKSETLSTSALNQFRMRRIWRSNLIIFSPEWFV